MITVNHLREFISETIAIIPEIKTGTLLIDDSQFAKIVKEYTQDDNVMLIGVIPSHPLKGSEDSFEYVNQLLFFLAYKSNEKDNTHDQFLDIMNYVQQVTKSFVEMLLAKKNETGKLCGVFGKVQEFSINIEPFWSKAGTDGYLVELDFITYE